MLKSQYEPETSMQATLIKRTFAQNRLPVIQEQAHLGVGSRC